ncbi:cytochrome P450 [Streptomyces pactum]|uniref:Cytochrome P450 n=1 Tax=Streptomyces pactum TaxID=68249 RepID=A0ABS0NEQ4_9ACTN|nr:cytochrome P450 [Streptomyces pactum]MBH5333646.1 cytochrome P450 [Streptomyces pactum]
MTAAPAVPRLFGDAFAADPEEAYAALRAAGPVAWAEIAESVHALVVTSHRAAVSLLNDTATYSKDSRRWAALNAGNVPPDSPVLALMAFRPSVLYADGEQHRRLRGALDDCMARIDIHQLLETTQAHARRLVATIAPAGRADLMTEFADTLPLLVFADILGCPAPLAERMVIACQGIIGAGASAAQAAADFAHILAELIETRSAQPGPDFTSWMLQHPARLSFEETLHQLYCFVGAGTIPTAAWIASGLRLLLEDDVYAGDLTGGTVTVRRAMEKVLWTRSPMANFSVHFARYPTVLHGVPVPPDVPVLISHAATGTDPALPPGLGYDNRSHLAWSAGPHRCPADSQAGVIAQTAIETVLDRLWDLELTDPGVPNRHGPFHQCPVSLNVRFRPQRHESRTAPESTGGQP